MTTLFRYFVVLLLGSSGVAQAAEGYPPERADGFKTTKSLAPGVVLTPSRLPQRVDEATSTVTVIDRAMIEASGARRLVDILRLVPGFQVGYKNNALPTAAYHGLTDEYARRVLLLINGQRIFQYARGVITWNNLPISLENIERIEVVRGPDAATYGSNALEAVINIQTGSAPEYAGTFGRIGAGDRGVGDGFIRRGGRVGPMNYMLSASTSGDDGYDSARDGRRNNIFSFLGELPFANGELQFQAGLARGQNEIEDMSAALKKTPRKFPEVNHFQTLKWRSIADGDSEWAVNLSHNQFEYRDRGFTSDQFIPGVNLNFNYEIEEERYEGDIQFFHRFSKQLRSVFGGGYYAETVRAPYYFDTGDRLDNSVSWLAGHVEYRPTANSVFNVGAMVERSSLTDDWLFLPQGSYHYHLDDRQTLRVAYSTGSRQPTLYENGGRAITLGITVPLKIYGVIASGGLDPEINRSLEVGYRWAKDRTHFDVRVFKDRYSDYIGTFYRPAPGFNTMIPGVVLDFANESPISVRGVEAQLDWHTPFGTRIFTSYALTDIDAAGTRFDAGYADSAPRHGFGLLASHPLGDGWQVSVNYDYQSGMKWYRDKPIGAYHQLGARIAKRFEVGSTAVVAELIGANVLGPIEDYLPDRSWDRSLFFRLSVDY